MTIPKTDIKQLKASLKLLFRIIDNMIVIRPLEDGFSRVRGQLKDNY